MSYIYLFLLCISRLFSFLVIHYSGLCYYAWERGTYPCPPLDNFYLLPLLPSCPFLCISYGPPSRTHSYHSGTSSGRFTGDSTVGFSPERQPPNVSNMTECTSIFRPKKPRKNGKITNKEPICQYWSFFFCSYQKFQSGRSRNADHSTEQMEHSRVTLAWIHFFLDVVGFSSIV